MAGSRPTVRTLFVTLALIALVAAACGGGGGKKKASSTGSTTSSVVDTSTTVGGSSTTTPAAAGTATTKAASKTATTTKGATIGGQPQSNYTPPAGSTPATPSQPGTYKYDTSGTASFGTTSSSPPPVTSLVVDAPAGTRQHSMRDSRTPDGNGSMAETTLDYQPQGVFLVELKTTTKAFGITDTTDLVANPPALIAPTGVKPGQVIEFDLSGSGANVHVKIEFVRTEKVTVGGQAVDTMVIHQTGTLSGKINGTQTSDSWAPLHGPIVKDHSVLDGTAYGQKIHSDITSTLQKLTPG
jgi:hypothetical protein